MFIVDKGCVVVEIFDGIICTGINLVGDDCGINIFDITEDIDFVCDDDVTADVADTFEAIGYDIHVVADDEGAGYFIDTRDFLLVNIGPVADEGVAFDLVVVIIFVIFGFLSERKIGVGCASAGFDTWSITTEDGGSAAGCTAAGSSSVIAVVGNLKFSFCAVDVEVGFALA